MDDNSIVIMRHHHFRMPGFHLRFYFGVLKLASALYMFCQISEIFGKKVKSGQLLAYFWPTFVKLLGVPNFLINAGIISVSGVFITKKNRLERLSGLLDKLEDDLEEQDISQMPMASKMRIYISLLKTIRDEAEVDLSNENAIDGSLLPYLEIVSKIGTIVDEKN